MVISPRIGHLRTNRRPYAPDDYLTRDRMEMASAFGGDAPAFVVELRGIAASR